jgi:glycosyltransferase involved in cell wall biosynthesis
MNPEDFKEHIAFEHEGRILSAPKATVVIVMYNTGVAILELLDSLKEQSLSSFEIIIINNGRTDQEVVGKVLEEHVLYLESSRNSVSLGRNIGTAYARGEVVIFLDDDCLAHHDVVRAHVHSYRDPSIMGVQGKGLPKRLPFYCHFQSHYDLGPTIRPAVVGFEANASFRKNVLDEVGGFDPELFGAEGSELSYRIVQKFKQPDALIYNPEAIIFHDFATGLLDYLEKCYRHPKMRDRLVRQHPRIVEFANQYGPYPRPERHFSSFLEKLAVKSVGLLGSAAEKFARYW